MQENPSNEGTTLPLTGDSSAISSVLVSDLGGLPHGTDGGDSEVAATDVPSTGGDASGDNSGTSDSFDGGGYSEATTVVEEPIDYTPGWPKVYTTPDYPVPMLSYFEKLPAGAELLVEVTKENTVSDVIALAREYGFSANSILNHMVYLGYEFQSQEDANEFNKLEY
ncbi:hypothetical protein P5_0004 [Aeromonas phage P5]|nr:hypothetical protein P5_0004 [Aeromonas phage P5]